MTPNSNSYKKTFSSYELALNLDDFMVFYGLAIACDTFFVEMGMLEHEQTCEKIWASYRSICSANDCAAKLCTLHIHFSSAQDSRFSQKIVVREEDDEICLAKILIDGQGIASASSGLFGHWQKF